MTKQEFFDELRAKLSGLSEEDINERISFYGEMIDDRIEEGISEEEAVRDIGDIDAVVSQILTDLPMASIVKDKIKPKRKLATWEIVLLIVGSPLWASLLLSFAAAVFSLYVALWSVIISFWAVFVSFAACAVALTATGVGLIVGGRAVVGVATIGAALLLAGLSIFTFFGCRAATNGALLLVKKGWLLIKKAIIGKERVI